MKKLMIASAVLFSAMSASAQWTGTQDGEKPMFTTERDYPATQMATSPTGVTWHLLNEIRNIDDHLTEIYMCQGYDETGKTIMGENPADLSTYPYQSWTMVNNNIFTDSKGNAIMAVQDRRLGDELHQATVYKISPTGEMLWGKDGVRLTGDIRTNMLYAFTGCELSDGSYVFAWANTQSEYVDPYSSITDINVVRVLEDGTLAWEPGTVKLTDSRTPYTHPFLIPAKNTQFNLVYAEGSNQTVMVMKYDFDGSPVWAEPVEVYNGGWGSTPMWTKCEAKPSGDGGVLFAWYDDRYFTNYEDAYLAYITPKGELGFNQRNGLRLDYTEGTRDLGVSVTYDKTTDSFLAFIRSANGSQSRYTMRAQRISKSGDLLWGEEAIVVDEKANGAISYATAVCGEDGRVAFFYQMANDAAGREVNNLVAYYDILTGKSIWEKPLRFGRANTPKSDLQVGSCGSFWTASWMGGAWIPDASASGGGYYSSSHGNINSQRINFDGTFGCAEDAIDDVKGKSSSPITVNGGTITSASDTQVFDTNGRLVAKGRSISLPAGIYTAVSGSESRKIVIQ